MGWIIPQITLKENEKVWIYFHHLKINKKS